MIRRSVREWECLHIGQGADSVSRLEATRLMAVAHRAQRALRIGGENGDSILIDRGHLLRAGQVVGILAASGVTLEILPKIDGLDNGATRLNLVRMLARTINLSIADGALTKLGHQHFDLLEILIRLYAAALATAANFREQVGNLDVMPSGPNGKTAVELGDMIWSIADEEVNRITNIVTRDKIDGFVADVMQKIELSLAGDSVAWKAIIPGKIIIRKFCGVAGLDYEFFR